MVLDILHIRQFTLELEFVLRLGIRIKVPFQYKSDRAIYMFRIGLILLNLIVRSTVLNEE